MTTLKETLPLLEKAVPGFPGQLADLEKEADDCAQAVRDLFEDLQKRKARAQELSGDVIEALVSLGSSAQTGEKNLKTALQAVESALAAATRGLETGADAVKDRLAGVVSAVDSLQDRAVEAQSRSMSAHQDVDKAFESLSDELDTGYDDVAKAVEESITEGKAVESHAEEGLERVVHTTGELVKLATDLGEETERTLGGWRATLREERGAHEEALDTALDAVREELRSCHVEREGEVSTVRGALLETFADVAKASGELEDCAQGIAAVNLADRQNVADTWLQLSVRLQELGPAVEEVKRGAAILSREW